MSLDRERSVAEAAAHAAADFIREHAGGLDASDVRSKGTHDLVTFVDEGAQRIVLDALREAFPDDTLLGEEGASEVQARLAEPRVWIVDPLDGTTNFTRGVPPYAVSIGLREGGAAAVGVVVDVMSGETFSAVRGGGCTVDGRPTRVAEAERLDESLISTGFPFRDYRYVAAYLETFEAAIRGTRGVRRHGSAAVDLAWVAAGRFDGFFEAGLAPWDVAAGVALVEAAGGRVAGLWPGADPVATGGLVAAAPGVFDALAEVAAPLGRAYRGVVEGDAL
ncbi:inositol monophosphatase family protein [Rubrivirga litoralis]|uniref:Inositol-1-monophosphatase n=1 Tax=Rubrivirga litoralis TaxID=3075598 RepID=A0ABU3BS27_9BACT|nr:inositol monophosphatase family protein [Rubrivirga sp. F394]MDT0632087.1 inositol monophosphatase family protein [Rubrivirga sp. F394]